LFTKILVLAGERFLTIWRSSAYKALPAFGSNGRIAITDTMHAALLAEMERTGVGYTTIFKKALNPPVGLKAGAIQRWKVRKASTTDLAHWNWVVGAYKALPTIEITVNSKERIVITDEMREALASEMKRTGVGAIGLIKNAPNPPLELKKGIIDNLREVVNSTVNANYWNWIMASYKALATQKQKITITDGMRKELIAEMERTEVGQPVYWITPQIHL
jgi:hypothetical protein